MERSSIVYAGAVVMYSSGFVANIVLNTALRKLVFKVLGERKEGLYLCPPDIEKESSSVVTRF